MEYVLEKMRIEIDLPTRDLNQLQMDFSNLNSNYYDTKHRCDLIRIFLILLSHACSKQMQYQLIKHDLGDDSIINLCLFYR